jgi:hypothetical protein
VELLPDPIVRTSLTGTFTVTYCEQESCRFKCGQDSEKKPAAYPLAGNATIRRQFGMRVYSVRKYIGCSSLVNQFFPKTTEHGGCGGREVQPLDDRAT